MKKSKDSVIKDTDLLLQTATEIAEYFALRRKTFPVPVEACGTLFQMLVWQELTKIPFGEKRTYKEIAQLIGHPKAAWAVGNACNKNNLLIVVPCHRVIKSDGSIEGFAVSTEIKKQLLEHEYCLINEKNMV